MQRLTVLDKLTYAGSLSNLEPVAGDPRLQIVQGDICDAPLVDASVSGQDAVVNFAAETHVDRSIEAPSVFLATNVLGAQTVFAACVRAGVDRVVQVSTDEVYGPVLQGEATEQDPLHPSSPYSSSKAAADLIALGYHRTYGLPVSVARPSNTYGPRQHPEKLIPRAVTSLLEGGTVPLYGDGEHRRSWLHVEDHCRAVGLVLTRGESGVVYNVGGGEELTNRELVSRLLVLLEADPGRIEAVPDRPGHDRRYAMDGSKLAALGYAPRRRLAEALPATVEWYRSHPEWWQPLTNRA